MSSDSNRFTVQAGTFEVTLEKEPDSFEVSLTTSQPEAGLELIHLKLTSPKLTIPGTCRLCWGQPLIDIQAFWRPGTDRSRALPADWGDSFVSQSSTHAPAGCLFNLNGENRHTFAFSDALNPVEIKAGVNEETATFLFSLSLFQVTAPFSHYEATLRLDTRSRPYYQSLNEVQEWWAKQPGYTPAAVPALARQPMYSTWYSFHQRLIAAEVEEECRLAAEMGCKAVIVDDGWQTSNNDRGYAYCGDWEVFTEKIPDMAAHVARIHDLGMKFILWYALPFVGPRSKNFERFSGKYLDYLEHVNTWVLDPRFPEVREFLIKIYEDALQDWKVDGFKIDFVQYFKQPANERLSSLDGRDYVSVPEATDRLLSDLIARLHRLNPDIMIEFRQPYIGPLMRKYGNMFRAGDCPNDSLQNRVRTLDVRLLCGNSAPHADMLMWHPEDPVESAALQIINVLFAVPQISVKLATLPPAHRKMLQFWLSFWQTHRELFLDGVLKPHHPELLYPLVEVSQQNRLLVAVYASTVVKLDEPAFSEIIIVNGTLEPAVILNYQGRKKPYRIEIQNCFGDLLSNQEILMEPGLKSLSIPASGLAILKSL
jgi:alpha-galactosidase